jgi:hypothetical protein
LQPEIKHLKMDLFLERVQSTSRLKQEFGDAKQKESVNALQEIENILDLKNAEYDVVMRLFLAYR